MKDKLTFEQECKLIANGEDLPKEKQIEKIAKRIHIATNLYYIECIKVATYLFEKDNCRIIDKNSVVLSREEAERFRGQTINLKKIKAKERKETAEKFANEVYKELYQLGKIYALPETLDADKYGIFSLTQEVVAKIAKEQFGVKIKE